MAINKLPTSIINKANGQPVDASEWNQIGGKINELIDSDDGKATRSEVTQLDTKLGALSDKVEEISKITGLKVIEDGFFFVDENLNIGVRIDNDGIHAKNIIEYEIINT